MPCHQHLCVLGLAISLGIKMTTMELVSSELRAVSKMFRDCKLSSKLQIQGFNTCINFLVYSYWRSSTSQEGSSLRIASSKRMILIKLLAKDEVNQNDKLVMLVDLKSI